ncbi:hypothetical protein AOLI_G00280590 [Acnodon oligacanthus]
MAAERGLGGGVRARRQSLDLRGCESSLEATGGRSRGGGCAGEFGNVSPSQGPGVKGVSVFKIHPTRFGLNNYKTTLERALPRARSSAGKSPQHEKQAGVMD